MLGYPRVGVLGGGQLGRMMAFAAHRLGLRMTALDPKGPDSPAGQVGPWVQGHFDDKAKVRIGFDLRPAANTRLAKSAVIPGRVLNLCSSHPPARF